jgi:hypothetical protein
MTKLVRNAMALLLLGCLAACSSPKAPPSAEAREAFDHLATAVALSNQASNLINQPPAFGHMSPSNFKKLQSLWRASLTAARQVNVALLNAEEPGFGDTFQSKFIRGLELCTQGNSTSDLIQGQLLLEEFGESLAAVKSKKS